MNINKINPLPNVLLTIGILPSSYLVSMTYEEQLLWLCNFLKTEVIPKTNANIEAVNQLITYIDNYFNNLDVQDEIDNKLNEMVEDGTFDRIINDELLTEINNKYDLLDEKVDNNYDSLHTDIVNQGLELNNSISNQSNILNNAINTQNLQIENNNLLQNNKINDIEDRVNQIASSSPKVVTSISDMTDHNQIYVLTTDGNWYYYNGTTFVSGGEYQAAENSDVVDLINKQLNELSFHKSINKIYTQSGWDVTKLPYNWLVSNSSLNIIDLGNANVAGTGYITLDHSKYYMLYAELTKNIDDTCNTGAISIFPYQTGTNNTPTGLHRYDRKYYNYPNNVGEPDSCYYAFSIANDTNCYIKIFGEGLGTSSKTLHQTINKICLLEFNTETDLLFCIQNYKYISLLGYVIPNDKYGNDKTSALEQRIDDIEAPDYDTDMLFWGDSLTAGAGGNGTNFPQVCATLLNKTYINNGIGGETAYTILARQGSITGVIPANASCNAITLKDINGNNIDPLVQGSTGVNPIKIDNSSTEYILSRNNDGTYSITHNSDVIPIANYPRFIRFKGYETKGRITIFFVGTNGPSNEDKLVNLLKNAIKFTNGKYIIMGLTTGTTSSRESLVNKLKAEFGANFFDSGYYLSQFGLNIENLNPTASDTIAINQGSVPPTLISEGVHLNNLGYEALGTLLSHYIGNLY